LIENKEKAPACSGEHTHHPEASLVEQGGEFFTGLFKTDMWPPRWYCGVWTPFHGWMYIISDILIWLSYFAIPVILLFYAWKKKDSLPFRKVFLLFVAFILACGLTHLLDAVIFWWPAYRLSALLRLATASVSVLTVFALVKIIPGALTLKSSEEYQKEIDERMRILHQFELFIKHTPGAIAIFDKDMRYIAASNKWCSEYGLLNMDIKGKTQYEVLPETDLYPEWRVLHQKALTGEVLQRKEHKIVSRDGSVLWLKWQMHPWYTDENEIGGIIVSTESITETKELELSLLERNAELEHLNEIYEATSEKARIGSWELDVASEEVYWSPAVYLIHELEKGTHIELERGLDYYHPDYKEVIVSALASSINSQNSWDLELKLITAKKREIWVRASGSPVVQDGKVVKLRGFFRDIDEKKKLQLGLQAANRNLEEKVEERTRQITEVNKELEAFTYSVSHDLRAPLRSINGYAQILLEDYLEKLDEEGQDSLNSISRNSRKMGTLIDDLLDFSRTGRAEVRPTSTDINEMVARVIAETEVPAGIPISWSVGKLHKAFCDHKLIFQVWQNLISNAVKYSSKNEKIEIRITSKIQEDKIIYAIEDNGAGFDDQYSDKLFGVFQRLHAMDEFEGTGVGLALVKRIMTKHKGDVWAKSTLGEGSTFYFSLPKTKS
jgi:PAS domain S-box-containing protein